MRPAGPAGSLPQLLPPDLSASGERAGRACPPGGAAGLWSAGARDGRESEVQARSRGRRGRPRPSNHRVHLQRGRVSLPRKCAGRRGGGGGGVLRWSAMPTRTRLGGSAAPSPVRRGLGEPPAGARCSRRRCGRVPSNYSGRCSCHPGRRIPVAMITAFPSCAQTG